VEYERPDFEPPYRVLVLVASTDGWYAADSGARGAALAELAAMLKEFGEEGATLVASFDDDLFLTGQPAPLPYTIFCLYDVDSLDPVVQLVHRLRSSPLSRYLRLEARVGRPLFVLDR
jgi:hypothetical protein